MTELEKPKTPRKKKPPTQTAGVIGIDAHGAMGEAPIEPAKHIINWQKLIALPAFEMFVYEQSGFDEVKQVHSWVNGRHRNIGEDALYEQYESWHEQKGLWLNETPTGQLIKESE